MTEVREVLGMLWWCVLLTESLWRAFRWWWCVMR